MVRDALRKLMRLPLEEKILNGASVVAALGVIFPWMSGEWLGGETVSLSGFGFYTSFLGLGLFFLHIYILLMTIIPLTGGPVVVRKEHREVVRLIAASFAAILALSALSVLTKFSLDFSRMQLRFGIYVSLIGSFVSVLYAFLLRQGEQRTEIEDLFHHAETTLPRDQSHEKAQEQSSLLMSSHPAPPAPEPEEHRILR